MWRRMEESDNISSQFPLLSSHFSVLSSPIHALRTENRELGTSTEWLEQVLFFQHSPVMQLMSGNDVGQRPCADFILIGDAAAQPGFRIEMPEEGHGRHTYIGEFFNQ